MGISAGVRLIISPNTTISGVGQLGADLGKKMIRHSVFGLNGKIPERGNYTLHMQQKEGTGPKYSIKCTATRLTHGITRGPAIFGTTAD